VRLVCAEYAGAWSATPAFVDSLPATLPSWQDELGPAERALLNGPEHQNDGTADAGECMIYSLAFRPTKVVTNLESHSLVRSSHIACGYDGSGGSRPLGMGPVWLLADSRGHGGCVVRSVPCCSRGQ
jgi:hypothetical protein